MKLPPNTQDVQTQAHRCKEALLALRPKVRHQKTQLFTLLYPVIVELLDKHVSQKDILAVLHAHGLKLHPSRFKILLAEHAARVNPFASTGNAYDSSEVQA